MSEPVYDVDYFIAKFEAIPEEQWCLYSFEDRGKCCALGHLGVRASCWVNTPLPNEALKLLRLFGLEQDCDAMRSDAYELVTATNNGFLDERKELTPRARILAALRKIKAKGAQ